MKHTESELLGRARAIMLNIVNDYTGDGTPHEMAQQWLAEDREAVLDQRAKPLEPCHTAACHVQAPECLYVGGDGACCAPCLGPLGDPCMAAECTAVEKRCGTCGDDPDDFRRTGDILRCCAGLMDEAAKADPVERVKLLCRVRNLTEHWFGVIGLDAARKG